MTPQFDLAFKLMLVGDHNVGKSCLAHRFASGCFSVNSQNTVGASYLWCKVPVEGSKIKVQICDTAGQERFRSVLPLFFRAADAVVVVYDTTHRPSFDNVAYWLNFSCNHADDSVDYMLLGNKCDCEAERQVWPFSGQNVAEKNGIAFFETSAKHGTNVDEAFHALVTQIKHRHDEQISAIRDCVEDAVEVKHVAENVRPCCA